MVHLTLNFGKLTLKRSVKRLFIVIRVSFYTEFCHAQARAAAFCTSDERLKRQTDVDFLSFNDPVTFTFDI